MTIDVKKVYSYIHIKIKMLKQLYTSKGMLFKELSYSMLEKHIADQDETPDYSEEIKRLENEIENLDKKRVNLR